MKTLCKSLVGIVSVIIICSNAIAAEREELPLHIEVTGTGTVELPVDYVEISIDIIVKDPKDQLKTKLKSDEDVRQILTIAKTIGIEEKDIDASYITIGPEYKLDDNENEIIVGYTSQREILIILRKLESLDSLLTKIIAIKSTQISDLEFCSDNLNDSIKENLYKVAIEKAKKQADMLSKLLGLKCGKILDIDFLENYSDEDFFCDMESEVKKIKSLSNSFLKKTITISKKITITYELEKK